MAPSSGTVVFARDELDLIVAFAGCSLDEKPGSNWVEKSGGLPDFICRIAKAIKRTGKSTSQAIAIAVSRVKKWATGAGVDKDTQAKAAAAVAEWEKLRAKSHAKAGAKKVAASHTGDVLVLSSKISSFNVDSVRSAWRAKNPYSSNISEPTSYIRELWTDHVIVSAGYDDDQSLNLRRVDYTVDKDGAVTFGDPVKVRVTYVTVKDDDMAGASLSDAQLQDLVAATPPCNRTATDKVLLSITSRPTAVETLFKVA